jgi:glutathione synthase/RimK-type ligase-like ATP-grasp enzyme
MNILFVVSNLRDWPVGIPGISIISARSYLLNPAHARGMNTKVFNLCCSYDYQSLGYYVSLLADARGHRPLPAVKAMEDIQSGSILKRIADNLDALIQTTFAELAQLEMVLHVYFGRHDEGRYGQLCEQLFNLTQTPTLHVTFRKCADKWIAHSVQMITLQDIAQASKAALIRAATECLQGHRKRSREPAAGRPRIAILKTHGLAPHPSNALAIEKFIRAAELLDMDAEVISEGDEQRLSQFDGLFIRDTTSINHFTYRMSRSASLAGLVVIDDPDSILRCTNKVFLAELLNRHRIPIPKTMLIQSDTTADIVATLGLPCILKQPDGAFSSGVVKVNSEQELRVELDALLAASAIVIGQEYLPTEFDWRVGVMDRRAIFVCRYYMAHGHWQIIQHKANGAAAEGRSEAFAIGEVPDNVIDVAVKAASLIGDGFYGVDLKQIGRRVVVIEINDNPNVDAGNEDGVLKDALYREIMGVFRKRIEAKKGAQHEVEKNERAA